MVHLRVHVDDNNVYLRPQTYNSLDKCEIHVTPIEDFQFSDEKSHISPIENHQSNHKLFEIINQVKNGCIAALGFTFTLELYLYGIAFFDGFASC